jgi:chemotaxis protein MotA
MLLPIGIIVAMITMMASTIMEGGSIGALIAIPSIVLVFGGTFGVTVACFTFGDVMKMPGIVIKALLKNPVDLTGVIQQLVELGDVARKEGHLALEGRLAAIEDPYLKHGLTLLVDGADEGRIREELDGYVAAMVERHNRFKEICVKGAGYAPILGLAGTTMGLINMLGHLSDPAEIGHSLAVAMTATLYGLTLGNVVLTPLADKLGRLHETEMMGLEMMTDGICTILHGLPGRAMLERLEVWLPPAARTSGKKAA